jgi:hypothetical protein
VVYLADDPAAYNSFKFICDFGLRHIVFRPRPPEIKNRPLFPPLEKDPDRSPTFEFLIPIVEETVENHRLTKLMICNMRDAHEYDPETFVPERPAI